MKGSKMLFRLAKPIHNEKGAIDLASIMVGIIVIGLVGGVIAATVFSVIPWSQDNAAKQQLDSIGVAQTAYLSLSSSPSPALPSGHPSNSYGSSGMLDEANLLSSGPNYCTVGEGSSYKAFAKSKSGKLWSITNGNTSPKQAGSWELNYGCEDLLEGASIAHPAYTDSDPYLTSMTFKCDTTTAVQLPIRNASGTAMWSGSSTFTHSGAENLPPKTLQGGIEYTFTFDGTYNRLDYFSLSGAECLRSLNHWGDKTGVIDASHAFSGAKNLTDVPDHLPSSVNKTLGMFYEAYSINDSDINKWDVSNVTNMNRMFYRTLSFNQPLNNWDMSNVVDMSHMFFGTPIFNQPLNYWNTGKVVEMDKVFQNAIGFNQPLSNWDVSSVRDLGNMFNGAVSFKQDLSGWDTKSLVAGNMFVLDTFPDEYMPPRTSKQ